MSLFAQDETLCSRENNKCKRREKCLRYMKSQEEASWVADYWFNFGRFCEYFVEIPKAEKTAKEKAGNGQ